jgi:hypothetical protein
MYKLCAVLSCISFLASSAVADLSSSQIELHPRFPGKAPFMIEIGGTWPSDCHPGEQKPVVESFDGHSVEIVFEIIVEHVTCNDVDTPYRVLVDMSESIRNTMALDDLLDIKVDFDGSLLQQTVDLVCPQGEECPVLSQDQQKPQSGLYNAPGLSKQGLLLTRQDNAMGLFPLVYDESGRAEWLFGGNHIAGDSFFSSLQRPDGGDCFGCEPTGATPELIPVGYLSVLFDSPGVVQVKINDGLFTEYRLTVFGYRTFQVGPTGEQDFIDIEGRWGISENRGTNPPLADITEFFPGAFDIVFESYLPVDIATQTAGQVAYLVTTLTGETLGQLFCNGQTGPDDSNACEFIDPTDAADPLFMFYQEGPTSLSMEYGRIYVDVGDAPGGRAVRLD